MSIIKRVTLQKIIAHDFRYDPRIIRVDPVTAEDRIPSQMSHYEICGGQSSTRVSVLSEYFSFTLSVSIHQRPIHNFMFLNFSVPLKFW